MNQSNPERTGRAMTMREIREALGHNVNPQPPVDRAAWVDGDPLLEAIARAVWEQCSTEGTSLVVDDPRNIAAVAAAVARAQQRRHPVSLVTGPQTVSHNANEPLPAAASAVVSPPTDRAACDCAAEVHMGAGFYHQPQCATRRAAVLPEPTDRAAALSEAERAMLTYALDQAQERIWVDDGFTHEDQAALDSLRRLAVEAHDTGTQQQVRDCPACDAGIAHTVHCPTPESHNWGCGCPGDRLPLYSDHGVDTPGCDCGHNGMGMRWHDGSGCAWIKQLTDEGRRLLAEDGAEPAPVAQQPAGDATVDPAMCPRCKGDNSEAFELCTTCAQAEQQAAAADGEETSRG